MFYYGFDNYMEYVFFLDEFRFMSCIGEDFFGGYFLIFVSLLVGYLILV